MVSRRDPCVKVATVQETLVFVSDVVFDELCDLELVSNFLLVGKTVVLEVFLHWDGEDDLGALVEL